MGQQLRVNDTAKEKVRLREEFLLTAETGTNPPKRHIDDERIWIAWRKMRIRRRKSILSLTLKFYVNELHNSKAVHD